jgi:hypothetical protein
MPVAPRRADSSMKRSMIFWSAGLAESSRRPPTYRTTSAAPPASCRVEPVRRTFSGPEVGVGHGNGENGDRSQHNWVGAGQHHRAARRRPPHQGLFGLARCSTVPGSCQPRTRTTIWSNRRTPPRRRQRPRDPNHGIARDEPDQQTEDDRSNLVAVAIEAHQFLEGPTAPSIEESAEKGTQDNSSDSQWTSSVMTPRARQ